MKESASNLKMETPTKVKQSLWNKMLECDCHMRSYVIKPRSLLGPLIAASQELHWKDDNPFI